MTESVRRVLLVDDDVHLLCVMQDLLENFSKGRWTVHTATEAAAALSALQSQAIDIVFIDVHMPLVDGVQILQLVRRRFPEMSTVVLTGDSTGAHRQACLDSGADLYLEKPRSTEGWHSIMAAVDQLARVQGANTGFRGVLKRVELQDVLQMECLSRSSSLFEVTDGQVSGRLYIENGEFIHAECGDKSGEAALNALLALKQGNFSLQPFSAPATRTLEGQWEFLLMEAARQRDEGSSAPVDSSIIDVDFTGPTLGASTVDASAAPGGAAERAEQDSKHGHPPCTQEVLLASIRGEVWHEWQSSKPELRIQLMTLLRHKSTQLGHGLSLGEAEQLTIEQEDGRVLVRLTPECSLFVKSGRQRSAAGPTGKA